MKRIIRISATIIVFLLPLEFKIIAQTQFELQIACDKASYTVTPSWISLALKNNGEQKNIDIYIAFVNPVNYIYFCFFNGYGYWSWSRLADRLDNDPVKAVSDVSIPEGFSIPLTPLIELKFPLGYNEYPIFGKYDLYFAIFEANTGNLLSNIAQTSITLNKSPGNWKNYTLRNYTHDLAMDGDTLWFSSGYEGGSGSINTITGEVSFYTNADGLIGNKIIDIAVDQKGRKWFAVEGENISDGGISVFDGYSWTHYNHTTAHKIKNNDIRSIAVDNIGRIWVGVGFGSIYSYDGKEWTEDRPKDIDGYLNGSIDVISPSPDGTIWCGTGANTTEGAGVWIYDNESWKSYTSSNSGLIDNRIRAISHDIDGRVWIGTQQNGISVLDGGNWKNYTTSEGLASSRITSIAIDSKGRKWIGTSDAGISVFDNKIWTNYTPENSGLASTCVYDIIIDSQDRAWFAANTVNITMFDGENWFNYNTNDNGLLYSPVTEIACDLEGRKWIVNGTSKNRYLLLFDNTDWTKYSPENSGIASINISTIFPDSKGNIWFGTYDKGISVFDGENWTLYNSSVPGSSFIADKVYAITEDAEGTIWIGTALSGLYSLDGENWTKYDTPNYDLEVSSVNAIDFDSSGRIWLATTCTSYEESKGIFVYDGVNWTNINKDNSRLKSNFVSDIKIDSRDRKWIVAESYSQFPNKRDPGSLYLFDDTGWTFFDSSNSPIEGDHRIYDITTDLDDKVYIASESTPGLYVYDDGNWTVYDTYNSGLVDNTVYSISIDQDGKKWFGTGNGISVLDDSQLE